MKTLIVYDSIFGNTEKVAKTMATTLGDNAKALRVGNARTEDLDDIDLLVVGSPTRGFSPTPSIKRWLAAIKKNRLSGLCVAAFDSRTDIATVNSGILTTLVRFFGYAAEPILRQLLRKGGKQALPVAGFFVEGYEGPIPESELKRAADWIRQIG